MRRSRRAVAAITAPVLAASGLMPAAGAVAGAAAITAVSTAVAAAPAKAATATPVLVLLQNGETTAPETTILQNAGYAVTQVTPSQWEAMSASQFAAYAALVIGDPSSGACSTLTPTTATTGGDALGTNWQGAVTGNLAVLGTAPALPGSAAANTLIADAVAYAATGWNSNSQTGTGLYESLNCEYSSAAAGTSVPLLNGVEGIGSSGGLTVQGSLACTDAGTVNSWEVAAAGTFSGFASASLAAGAPAWPSPSCPVQEAFDSWPGQSQPWAGTFTPVGYDAASDAAANFTASDGATGQAYILLGSPPPATQAAQATLALTPSTGGQVPAGSVQAGAGNPAAPGVSQAAAGGANTENGDFTQSATDVSIPTFGPDLSFTRTYDTQLAQQQTRTGTPGPMGYGWTDNWASSLSAASPVPGDIYTLDGLRTPNGNNGPPASAQVGLPGAVITNSSNVYIADTHGNRVLEIPGSTGTQWGISMTAGDTYTIAGSPLGLPGCSPNGMADTSSKINGPSGLAFDSSGNLYISDSGNSRVLEMPATNGTYWNISMNANAIYTVAGHSGCGHGTSGDGGVATNAYLWYPLGIKINNGDLYIADAGNNRVQEIYGGGNQWNQTMSLNDIYTVAGQQSGAPGNNGAGGPANQAYLNAPSDISFSSAGDMYIAVTGNNKVQEVAKSTGAQWGLGTLTANDIYNIVGAANGTPGQCNNGATGPGNSSCLLDGPTGIIVNNGTNLYISDALNNRVEEVAQTTHAEWGISMTQYHLYRIAGSSSGTSGFSGDGGSANSALMNDPQAISVGSSSFYIADSGNDRVRLVNSSDVISEYAGTGYGIADIGNSGPAIDAGLAGPQGEAFDSAGDIYIADAQNNRIQEIAASTHTQYGINMTAGDVYTIAGSPIGVAGYSGDGGTAASAMLNLPLSITIDGSGNLFIADTLNCRIRKITTSGTISTVAGSGGQCGTATSFSGNAGPATQATLSAAEGMSLDSRGDIYIADTFFNQVEEVYTSGGQTWGRSSSTAGDIYVIAGNGTQGHGGNGGAATSANLYLPDALGIDGAGSLYISDFGNNRIQEVPVANGTQRGQSMIKYDMYTIAGHADGTSGMNGDGGPATAAYLNGPGNATVDTAGNLYITDGANNRIQEVPVANGTQWGQAMTANYVYTVAGSATGQSGSSGDGGPATSALMSSAQNVSLDSAGDMYVTDGKNNRLREVTSATAATISPAPGLTSALYPSPGGITIAQPGGAQVTFYSQSGGNCTAPYVTAGQYCALPQYTDASLTLDTGTGLYTFSPEPGSAFKYNSAGQLRYQTDVAGETLSVSYGSPAPGSGQCPSSASSCDTITSAAGRAITIGLNGSNRITSVTDPLARRWSYSYSGNDLASATTPASAGSRVTTYTYDTGNANPLLVNDMATITSPNGQAGGPDAGAHTALAYDSSGRLISRTDPMGYQTTYNWTGFNPSTGTGFIAVSDPDGNKAVYYYMLGTLAAESHWTGSNLTIERDYVPQQSGTGNAAGTQLDVASADGNGNITTTSYDTAGNPLTVTTPDGVGTQTATTTQASTSLNAPDCVSTATASSTCSQAPGPSPVTAGGVITPPSSAAPQGVTWDLYDNYGNDLWTTTGVYEPGSTTASYLQTTYHLYTGNSVTLPGTSTAITCAYTPAPPSPTLPCAAIDANGVVTQLGYNPQGDLVYASTPDGNGTELATTTYAYDGDGEQTSVTSPDGNLPGANAGNYTTTATWNADSEETSITHAGGTGATVTPRTTNYGYDADGNQVTVQDPRGFTTTTAYNADDEATLVGDPDNNSALTCFDGVGHVTQTVPPVGVAANSLTASSCPSSYPAGYGQRLAADATAYTFNALGQETQMTTPAPAGQTGYETTSYTYDSNGNLLTTTAPPAVNGGPSQVTVDSYNSAGELASETTGFGTAAAATISYCYDSSGNRTSVVYADGNTAGVAPCDTSSNHPWIVDPNAYPNQAAYQTTNSYDSAGELASLTRPATAAASSGATTTFTYDPAGNQLTSTDPNGITTTMTYTPAGDEASITYSGSSAHSASYGFDASGNMTSMADATGTSGFSYDPFGELTSVTNGAGQTVGYGYDGDGDPTAVTYPLPAGATWSTTSTVNYTYDNADLLTKVTDFNGNPITIGNTADTLPGSFALGSTGDTITTSYDNSDAPSAITLKNSSSTLQSFSYSDAPASTILSECDTTPSCSQPSAAYTYDARGRVTSMTPGGGTTVNYGFDPSGNLTTLPTGADATTGYDKAGELTSSVLSGATTTYSYNADGQRLTATHGGSTVASGTWNGAGQLTGYTSPAGSMASAVYDGEGLRASATFTPSGGSPVTQQYVWDPTSDFAALLMDSSDAYIYADSGTPAEQVNLATGAITYLVADSLGSVRGTVNGSGALTGTTSYDAWGNPASTGGLTASTPFGYAGGYADPTGLIYLINRYYDPASGQFTSLDPLVDQTLEPYSYTAGNPVSETDPTGLVIPSTGGGEPSHHHHHRKPVGSGPSAGRIYWIRWRFAEHRAAVYTAIGQLALQAHENFGLGFAQLTERFRTEHVIEGVDKAHLRLDPEKFGRADITFSYDGAIWVWEVKSITIGDLAAAEARLYVEGLNVLDRNGKLGFPLTTELEAPTPLGVMKVLNYEQGEGDGSTGAIVYDRSRLRQPPADRVPVFAPARDSLHAAVRAALEAGAGGLAALLVWLLRNIWLDPVEV